MFTNYYMPISYEINLLPNQVTGRTKSKTCFSNRITKGNEDFEGDFFDNKFKIHFMLPGNIWIHQGHNPNFYGVAEKVDNHTKLTIKMRPDKLGWFMLILWLIFQIAGLFITITSFINNSIIDGEKIEILFILNIMPLAFLFIFFFGISKVKYNNIKVVLEEMFEDDMIK